MSAAADPAGPNGASGPVWRGMTAEEIRTQYDMRAAVPDGPAFSAARRARSDLVRARLGGARDLRYGLGPRQTLDIYPADRAAAPVLVFFHGGAWRSLSKEVQAYMAEPLVAAGVTLVLPGYGLLPDVPLRRMVEEAREAVAWVARHIAAHGGAPHRITVGGMSAGAQLAAMTLAYDYRVYGLARAPLRGSFLMSGVYDLEPHRHHARHGDMGLDEDLVQACSPACNPPLDPDLPMVFAVGDAEAAEFRRQTRAFRDICAARGHPTKLMEGPGDHHFSIVDRLGDPRDPLFAALADLASTA